MPGVDFGDHVDNATFLQILEMDEDGHDFSQPLVFNFFEQAEDTFEGMDVALAKKDLGELSKLGHFLKGSSATLGFNKVRDSCQIIQQYGSMLNVDGTPEADANVCLQKIEDAIKTVKDDFEKLKEAVGKFFELGE